ncbi:MAG: carbohydrate ABC transporter permease [Abditibacteriota bacterium]|nr:carbohydrate ABC transporter permease [Abditibacteriota bacterium]MBP5093593.1 carbohydrate ABC transporter permease [Abditibacteriota bacterium]
MKAKNALTTALAYIIILAGAALFILPLLWMITVSLARPETIAQPGFHLIPREYIWENYKNALTLMPFGTYAMNTIKVTFLALAGNVITSALVAFAFARLEAPGKNVLFIFVLSTIMLPSMVTMIPSFIIFKSLGWYDTLLPLIAPAWFANAFYIFLMRQFFMTIPKELEDAAKIDGCSTFGIFRQIIMPLSKPVIVSVAVFSFVAHWNDFMSPLIYLNSIEKRTLALGLATFTDVWGVDIVSLMAASTAVLIPVLIIFFFSQKYFVQGVVMTGIKG